MSGTLQRAYLEADPRSLAAGRIALALVLLLDLARRAFELDVWYTNDGLLPNHTVLWRPTFEHLFSFFFMASTRLEAAVGFAVCAAAYVALLVGYRTRLAQLASLACVLSLHARMIFVQNGGDVVLSELALWTAFLPTGARFSLDSLLARMRARDERSAADLVPRDVPDTTPIVSRAVLALRLQLVAIYLFNALQKTGADWRDGSVVHWVLHQDRIVTAVGLWVRGWIEPWQSALLTWSSLGIEAVLPILLLSPIALRGTRRAAIVAATLLHLGFGLFLNLGVFVPAMIAYLPNLLVAEDWDALARRASRKRPRRIVLFDASCGFCFQCARVLARLDPTARLEIVGNDRLDRIPEPIAALADETIIVVDPETNQAWTGARAFAEIFRALPGGTPIAWLLLLGRPIAEPIYARIAANRSAVSAAFGLTACGIAPEIRAGRAPEAESPLRRGLRSAFATVAEAIVVVLLVVAASQLTVENPAVPEALRFRQPRWMSATVTYLQLFQGWKMFAPDAPHGDRLVAVAAKTGNGEDVDPLNHRASPRHPDPREKIPPRLGYSAFFCEYVARISSRPEYFPPLRDWILKQGPIASFIVHEIDDESPPPGEREPRHARARELFQFP